MRDIDSIIQTAFEHYQSGRVVQAEELFGQVLESEPNHAGVLHLLGVIAHDKADHDTAVDLLGRAIENYSQAIKHKPDYAEAYNNIAAALQGQGNYETSMENCGKAISLKGDYAQAYNTMGSILQNLGRYEEAIENYSKAIGLAPDYAEVHNNLGMGLLLKARFAQGWQEYEWRLKCANRVYPHHYQQPLWDGRPFAGKRILVHYEQGFGDSIQFVRYLPMIKQRGGTVIFEERKPLIKLFENFDGIDELIETSSSNKVDVAFDFYLPLLSAPMIFGTTLESVPSNVPYLKADPVKIEYWREKVKGDDFKVGVVWAGLPSHKNDHNRSCRLEHFGPLSKMAGVKLYGLQKGEASREAEYLREEMEIVNLGEQLEDFADTAGAIENMDLIISVDTSVLHLAGAMGKCVWGLIPYGSEWRWMLERQDSPWYPGMKLFRQKKSGDWAAVFESVQQQLKTLAK
ncbi:tetratricopeptide repeat protein [Planctomycetota bacterium]